MLQGKLPTKHQREVMRQYDDDPRKMKQIEVMRQLDIIERADFYRLFFRCRVMDRLEELEQA